MFINLFNLVKSTSQVKTPLEDFTTEGFSGILKQNKSILKAFLLWLELPVGNYMVSTQVKYALEDDDNCIVDMVLESESTVCFIENKVNSKEGHRQIERYAKVLDLSEKENKFLKYCTKRVDSKPYLYHNFKQFRWYEISNWLEHNFPNVGIVKDYLKFLKKHNMAKNTSITTDTVISMNKFFQTYEAMDFHVKNAVPNFMNHFPNASLSNRSNLKAIETSDRIERGLSKILTIKTNDCELLYCVHFESVKLQTQIWISLAHPQALVLLERAKSSGFQYWQDENGIGIFKDCKLYQFIESQNSDQEIKNWFENSFSEFRHFIDLNLDLDWDKMVLK